MTSPRQNLSSQKSLAGKLPGWLLMFVASATILLTFAWFAGAFNSDLGGDPDEAAHAVTALMVRDYLKDGLGTHPMTFAKSYYEDFPRVALGHYPPLYYLLTAPLLLPVPSVNLLLVLQSLTLAGLATLTYRIGTRFLPPLMAAAAGLGLLALPVGLKLALHVMSDILLAFFCLWAALLWAWYLRAPSIKRALLWGCVAAAAILTKGSAMGLCLLPPLGALLAGRWRLVFSWSWWYAALPVAVLAGPWMLYSTKISKEGMTKLSPVQYFLEAVPFHLKAAPMVYGWPLAFFATLGLVIGLLQCWKRKSAFTPEAAALAAMSCGMLAVLLLVPVGLSMRYMLTLAPPVLLLAAAWIESIAWRAPAAAWVKALLLVGISFGALGQADIPPSKDVHGFAYAVIRSIIPGPAGDSRKQHWLVVSDPQGEGAIVAAGAFHSWKRSPSLLRMLRGSKALSTSDWMGRDYTQAATTEAGMLDLLDKLKVDRVFLDLSVAPEMRREHELLLEKTLAGATGRWTLDFAQDVSRTWWIHGKLLVYKRS